MPIKQKQNNKATNRTASASATETACRYVNDRYETCYLVGGENVILSFFCFDYIIGVLMIMAGHFSTVLTAVF